MDGEKKNNFKTGLASICGDCVNSVGLCSWSAKFIPVEGWKAEPVKRRLGSGDIVTGFAVKECPKFIMDVRKKEVHDETIKQSYWTVAEKKYVFQNYGKIPTCQIAKKLNRTVGAVHKVVSVERKRSK